MSVNSGQIWVTTVTKEEEFTQALVLSFSLKRSYTSRKLVLIASPGLSAKSKYALSSAFDLIIYMEDMPDTISISDEQDLYKLYAVKALRMYTTAVYIAPSMIVLENCDDIFDQETNVFAFLQNDTNASIFLFYPSLSTYSALLDNIANFKCESFSDIVKRWTDTQFKQKQYLNKKFGCWFRQSEINLEDEASIPLINLLDYPLEHNFREWKHLCCTGRYVMAHWHSIYQEFVFPLISNPDNGCLTHTQEFRNEPVAIVGMSCRHPGCNSVKEFWDLLYDGKDGTSCPPEFRWLKDQSPKVVPAARNTNAGFLKIPLDEFDAKFFGISPKEVVFMDPQHRILHEVVWEALENACVNPHDLRETHGSVFVGSWMNDYKNILLHSGQSDFYRLYMGNSIGACAARISFMLGMTGPSVATESGCSSAMVALHLAVKSLQMGETSIGLACGVNLLLHPFDGTEIPMVVSPDGRSKTFSDDANGFARAEGVGVLVLKRISDAIRDKDHIWGLIRGSALAQEGVSKSMGTPTVYSESLAMKNALYDANVNPEKVSYIEAHGTGTTVGDPIEICAIAKAYNSPKRNKPLIIGSVKTNVGHTESCSGITGVMKVVLAMKHNVIPAHLNFTKLNPSIDLNAVPAVIPLQALDWKSIPGTPKIAGVSSFGVTGTDVHVIIQDAPNLVDSSEFMDNSPRPFHILKLSAKTDEALDKFLAEYKSFLKYAKDDIADICYSANTGRANFTHRAILTASSKENFVTAIEKGQVLRSNLDKGAALCGKVCFLFTGQGSQYKNMAKEIYETSPIFRIHFDHCSTLLKKLYNIDIKKVLWDDFGQDGEINKTLYSQPSIFCVEYAMQMLWKSIGIKPDYVLGHSLGEFAAAVCANLISVDEAIKLLTERSILIDALPPGKMLVVKTDYSGVKKLISSFTSNRELTLDYAAFNSSEQTVLAGDSGAIESFSELCKNNNIKTVMLNSTHAFHSKHMDGILEKYREAALGILSPGKVKVRLPSCEYISAMSGTLLNDNQTLKSPQYWNDHTRQPVRFRDASRVAIEQGCTIFIEMGPQPVLSALTMDNNDGLILCLPSIKKQENNWKTLLTSVGKLFIRGFDIDFSGIDKFQPRKKLALPHYPFQGKKFWPDIEIMATEVVHPLLGADLPNASSTKLFQCSLGLKNFEWIKDHMIGTYVIFPGAGYLEMSLAAGIYSAFNTDFDIAQTTIPMKIENLVISAPISIEDSKPVHLQTLVESAEAYTNATEDITVKVFRLSDKDSSTDWICHAHAKFSPVTDAKDRDISFDIAKVCCTSKYESRDELLEVMYDTLKSLGLSFGPSFRSVVQLWQIQNNCLLTKIKVPSNQKNGYGNYVVHPVILDAMIQSILLLKHTSNLKRLYVPVSVGKFVLLASVQQEPSSELFIQAYDKGFDQHGFDQNSTNGCTAVLLNKDSKPLCIMSNVELTPTTARAVETVINQQIKLMPDIWVEKWNKQNGPAEDIVNITKLSLPFPEHDQNLLAKFNECSENICDTVQKLERLTYLYMLKALYDCGWNAENLRKVFNQTEAFNRLKIQKQYYKQFGYFLHVLKEEGLLHGPDDDMNWNVIQAFPSSESIEKQLKSPEYAQGLENKFNSTKLITKLGERLGSILMGNLSALEILFNDDEKESHVSMFYQEYSKLLEFKLLIHQLQTLWLGKHQSNEEESMGTLRILEVGAGTGAFTQEFLQILDNCNIKFEYTFTDISPAFFIKAEKKFEKWHKQINYKLLNIEEDPLTQGFVPGYFDYVCGSDVIHATRNLKESLQNLRILMKPEALLDICEQIEVSRIITFIFGLLDGFWRFEDIDVRPKHCIVDLNTWSNVLEETGFQVVRAFPCFNNKHGFIRSKKTRIPQNMLKNHISQARLKPKKWVVFHDASNPLSEYLVETLQELSPYRELLAITRKESNKHHTKENVSNLSLSPTDPNDFCRLFEKLNSESSQVEAIIYCWALNAPTAIDPGEILQPFFFLCQAMHTLKRTCSLNFCVLLKSIVPLDDCNLSGYSAATIPGVLKCLQNEDLNLRCKLVDVGAQQDEVDKLQIFYEIWNSTREIFVAFKEKARYVSRMTPIKVPPKASLELPLGTDRFQLLLPESKAIADLSFVYLEPWNLSPNEIEIQVKASSLNFRDILTVFRASAFFENFHAIGLDFAGIVTRVGSGVSKWSIGDRVFGLNFLCNTALPSHLKLPENTVGRIPTSWTFLEAASLSVVVATCFKSLIDIARVGPDDTVLIHTASGGVGLYAIQICKHLGAKVIATAGSKRKQSYLRNLGVEHVFHSRNTSYLQDIMRVTNGRGVNVVLNSLTSDGFKESTLQACAPGARFIEMSQLRIWTPEEVSILRPDIQYTVINLTAMSLSEWIKCLDLMDEYLRKKVLTPIPLTKFKAVDIRQGLMYMQKAKHIGKIICVMPDYKFICGRLQFDFPMFCDNSTYLITGGLGGIGFQVCHWMVKLGAKYVVLAGRSSPDSKQLDLITRLNNDYSAKICYVILDVANFEDLQQLIESKIPGFKYPPLKGVMHAAGILRDSFIENHTWDTFSSTFASKVYGTLNLHKATLNITGMEHFVMFSSIVSLIGSPGQSNHAAGNSFEDSIALFRHSQGLPATTINWGQWSEVGIATEVVLAGVRPFSTRQGLEALQHAMYSQQTQTGFINIESIEMLSKWVPLLSWHLDEVVWNSRKGTSCGTSSTMTSQEFWASYNAAKTMGEKVSILRNPVRGVLRSVLKMEGADELDDSLDFQQMGVDSLMFTEIKNDLQSILGDSVIVNASLLKDCNTIEALSTALTEMIEGVVTKSEDTVPTLDEVQELIESDSVLPDHIKAKATQRQIEVDEISFVLLTGATGVLGPYILRELCNLHQIQEVVCLVRPRSKISAETRLLNVLKERCLLSNINQSKIRYVVGNIAEPMLGMEEGIWKNLCDKIDGVIHCAAKVSHVEHYTKNRGKDNVRNINVSGVKNILEFATTGEKLKHVFAASTVLTISNVSEAGNASEDWPKNGDLNGVTTFAYPVSKFVGDLLMKTAITERGIPGKVFRFPFLSGDSKTGRFVLEQNHLMLRFIFNLTAGVMHSTPMPTPLIPVDVGAWASIRLFFDSRVPDDIYTICNKDPDVDQEFLHVANKLGYKLECIEFSEFSRLIRNQDNDSPFAIFKDFYRNDADILALFTTAPALREWFLHSGSRNDFFISKKLPLYLPELFENDNKTSMDYIYNDMLFAKQKGWLADCKAAESQTKS